jgi:hypothetical protein
VFREKLGSKDVVVVSNWSAQTRTSEADIIKQYKPILPLNVAIPGFSTTYRGSSQESEANPHQALRIVVHDEFYLITSLELATAAELREAFQGIFNCTLFFPTRDIDSNKYPSHLFSVESYSFTGDEIIHSQVQACTKNVSARLRRGERLLTSKDLLQCYCKKHF